MRVATEALTAPARDWDPTLFGFCAARDGTVNCNEMNIDALGIYRGHALRMLRDHLLCYVRLSEAFVGYKGIWILRNSVPSEAPLELAKPALACAAPERRCFGRSDPTEDSCQPHGGPTRLARTRLGLGSSE